MTLHGSTRQSLKKKTGTPRKKEGARYWYNLQQAGIRPRNCILRQNQGYRGTSSYESEGRKVGPRSKADRMEYNQELSKAGLANNTTRGYLQNNEMAIKVRQTHQPRCLYEKITTPRLLNRAGQWQEIRD